MWLATIDNWPLHRRCTLTDTNTQQHEVKCALFEDDLHNDDALLRPGAELLADPFERRIHLVKEGTNLLGKGA